mgnify:CR=1 FL=1
MDFKQSETKKNLMRAFAGESQARNRYIFAAAQAKEQKMQVVEFVFRLLPSRRRRMQRFLSAFEGAFGGNGSH